MLLLIYGHLCVLNGLFTVKISTALSCAKLPTLNISAQKIPISQSYLYITFIYFTLREMLGVKLLFNYSDAFPITGGASAELYVSVFYNDISQELS